MHTRGPTARGICVPVGETSAALLYEVVWSVHVAVIQDVAGCKVCVHAAPARIRLGLQVGMRIQLSEHLLKAHDAKHVHPGLVAIVPRAPVSLAEDVPDGDVGQFLAVAKNAELGLSAEDLAATDQAGLTRTIGKPVIFQDLSTFQRKVNMLRGSLDGSHALSPVAQRQTGRL